MCRLSPAYVYPLLYKYNILNKITMKKATEEKLLALLLWGVGCLVWILIFINLIQ